MRILVTGGSASGKSEFAEKALLSLSGTGERLYVATMPVFTAEDQMRKEKHLCARQGRGFITIERPDDLAALRLPEARQSTGRFVLLEDIGNLAANEMFGAKGAAGAADRIAYGAIALAAQCSGLIIVSVDVSRGGGGYAAETLEYIRIIELVNRSLAAGCDEVYEVVAGIPIRLK